ncbi:MAG: erythromycin esterase family protein [Clostridium butyricum]|nr:erythromycin esterase family protein [Clostridium butyricum]
MKVILKKFHVVILSVVLAFGIIMINPIKSYTFEKNQVDILKENIKPLKSVNAESEMDDLEFLKENLKDKTIIGMGEVTHGNDEIFKAKHRIFKFLVEELNYKVFAIEGDFGGAEVVNDYIVNGNGTPEDAIKSMGFWTWSTEEVLDMVKWMRKYNQGVQDKDKIKFYGFDFQMFDVNRDFLKSYLSKSDNELVDKYKSVLNDDINCDYIKNTDNKKRQSIFSDLKKLQDEIEQSEKKLISNSNEDEYEKALQNVRMLKQFDEWIISDYSGNVRDKYMAENINWILNYEGKKGNDNIFLWAHNGHIDKNFTFPYTSMGKLLYDQYKEKYYAIGTEFYKSQFTASNKMTDKKDKFEVGTNKKWIADLFHETGVPIGYLDLKDTCKNEVMSKIFGKSQTMHSIGAVFNSIYGMFSKFYSINTVPIKSFDGILYIDEITPTILLK